AENMSATVEPTPDATALNVAKLPAEFNISDFRVVVPTETLNVSRRQKRVVFRGRRDQAHRWLAGFRQRLRALVNEPMIHRVGRISRDPKIQRHIRVKSTLAIGATTSGQYKMVRHLGPCLRLIDPHVAELERLEVERVIDRPDGQPAIEGREVDLVFRADLVDVLNAPMIATLEERAHRALRQLRIGV